jgi:hypothetical protein
MPGGYVAFAAEDPGLGIVDPGGKVVAYRGPDIVNFSAARTGLHVSADGAVISYPLTPDGTSRHTYAAQGGGDQSTAAEPSAAVFPPRLSAPGVEVANWQDQFTPTINGRSPELDDYEMSHSYAVARTRCPARHGMGRATIRPGRKGNLEPNLPAVAWSVNVSRNGQMARGPFRLMLCDSTHDRRQGDAGLLPAPAARTG